MILRTYNYFFFALLVLLTTPADSSAHDPSGVQEVKAVSDISFIRNQGQWVPEARYKAEIPGGALFITDRGFVYNFESTADWDKVHQLSCGQVAQGLPEKDIHQEMIRGHAYKVNFEQAQRPSTYREEGKRSYYHNYFMGNDPTKWAGQVGLFEKIVQKEIYNGIDLIVYSQGTSVKYDFIVAPKADPGQIMLSFEGVAPELTAEGHLKIKTTVNEVLEQAPYVYQVINGKKVTVPSRYRLVKGILTYEMTKGYDPGYELVIDPTLVFSTYSGSTGSSHLSYATTYDQAGNLYAGAYASSPGWPTTTGAYQTNGAGGTDVGINKYNATGTALLYSTYYGGSGVDAVSAMITNSKNELFVIGTTSSFNMPFTTGCYDSTFNGGQDIFVVHFNSTGTGLLGATYMGGAGNEGNISLGSVGTMSPMEITLDGSGNIWVASNTSNDFPVTANALKATRSGTGSEGVLFQLTPDCSKLLYSTFIGGTSNDACFNVIMNAAGNVVVCGATESNDFPVTSGVLHPTYQGAQDGFVCIVNAQTGALMQATYLGTSALDQAFRLQVDKMDNVWVLGRTLGNYPVSTGVYQISGGDIFIDKLASDLSSSLLSTRVCNPQTGSSRFIPAAFLYDICGNVYVAGFSAAAGLPTTTDAYETAQRSFWFCVLEPDFTGLIYASYFGTTGGDHSHNGVHRFDPQGIVYQTICSSSPTFPITAGAVFPEKKNSGLDNLSFKFNFDASGVKSRFVLPPGIKDTVCAPYTLEFINNSTSAKSFIWDFGDGSPLSNDTNARHTFTVPGVYTVNLYAHNDSSCVTDDTSRMQIVVLYAELPDIVTEDTILCSFTQAIEIGVTINNPGPNQKIFWEGAGMLSPADRSRIRVNPSVNTVFYVTVKDTLEGICGLSVTDSVVIDLSPRVLVIHNKDSVVCEGTRVSIKALGMPGYSYHWSPSTGLSDSTALEPDITIFQPQQYILTGSYPGCPDTSVGISFGMHYMPRVDLGPDRTICQDTRVGLESSVQPYRSDYSYQWSPVTPNLEYSDLPHTYFMSDTTITYYLTVKTPIGCTGIDSIRILVYPGHFGAIIADTGLCLPDFIQLWAEGGTEYAWTPAYGLSDTTLARPVAAPETSTDYTVYIRDRHGCLDSQQVSVQVYPAAVIQMPDTVNVYSGERYHVEPETNGMYFSWFPPSGLSTDRVADPWMSPEVRTRYFVTARTEHGCTVEDSIDIQVLCTIMDMPNAFTPGSGSNGLFKPSRRGMAELKRFTVFNRWGEKMFETTDLEKGWDGRYKDHPQPIGVYVYIIEAITACGDPYYKEGNVTLIR